MPYPYIARPLHVCTPSFLTIKVLTRLFQAWLLHKSFPFSLLHPIASFLRGNAVCVFKGSIPRQPLHRFSSSYLLPPCSFSSSANCLIPLLLSAIRCQPVFKSLPKGSIPESVLWFFFFFFPQAAAQCSGCSVDRCCGQVSHFFFFLFSKLFLRLWFEHWHSQEKDKFHLCLINKYSSLRRNLVYHNCL